MTLNKSDEDSPWGRKRSNDNVTEGDELLRLLNKIIGFGKIGGGGSAPKMGGKILPIGLLIFVLWGSSGLYKVQEGEHAIVLRFGREVRSATAGLHYHIPTPIEDVIKRKVEFVRQEEIGFRSGIGSSNSGAIGNNIPEESLMLTADENIVDINFVVQWKIKNLRDYLFKVQDYSEELNETVKHAAESSMREIIGNTNNVTQQEQRPQIEMNTKKLLQSTLDSYECGVEIINVNLKKIDPPAEVMDAYREVQSARADKERKINEAQAYSMDILPRAGGDAARIVQDAEAYKHEVIALATGEVSRFNAVYEQYKKAKDVTRKRIYLETMETILPDLNKIIIDSKAAKNILPYLPLPSFSKKGASNEIKDEKR